METRIQIVAIVATGGLFVVLLELVRRRRMLERYAILWLFCAVALLGLSVWKGLLNELAHAVGIFYAPSALFVVAFGFVLVLLLHFSVAVSRLADQNKVLAQRDKDFNVSAAKLREDRGKAIGYEVPQIPQPKSVGEVGRQWTPTGDDKPAKRP